MTESEITSKGSVGDILLVTKLGKSIMSNPVEDVQEANLSEINVGESTGDKL